MTKQEIKTELEQSTYSYNQNDQWALDFWEEAAEKCPKLVEKDFKELNAFVKNDKEYGDVDGFELNETYKKMFKDLNLN